MDALNHQWFKINAQGTEKKQMILPIVAARKEIKMDFEEKDKHIEQTTE